VTRVLISGNAVQVSEVADELRSRGAVVTEVADLDLLPGACSAAGPAAFDSYVQLPATFTVRGDTAIHRVHHFYADGVLARFPALAAVLPALKPAGRVTFVLGHLPPEVSTPEDREARQVLVRVLGHAARADAGEDDGGALGVRMLDSGSTPRQVATVALGGDPARDQLRARLADMSYEEWRVELMGLVSVET
jgi:hypothetical protein